MPPAYEDGKVHLDVLGEAREIDCKVRVGRTRLKELLPLARSLSASITAIGIERARKGSGKEVTCQKGCDFCCRQLIPIAPLEAKRLAEVVAAMPKKRADEVRRRFSAARAQLVEAGLLPRNAKKGSIALASAEKDPKAAWDDVSRQYYALHIDCPFLADGACSIYDERPLACREYNAVTDPALCETLDPAIEATPRPLRFGEILTEVGNELASASFSGVPLALALEWAEVHGKKLDREGDGEAMFWTLVSAMERAGE